MPWEGIEVELAEQGALVELSELLPQYAPNIWKSVPEEIWDIVRANSPDGKSIYYIPSVWTNNYGSGFVRVDWMKRIGATKVPQTTDEYVSLLKRIKAEDANGNGDPNDEYPTGGRQLARWMDHLYAPFGVTMYEGYPDFGVYDGELTYSGITENMKAATAWIASLYKQGLMDPETLLNSKKMWDGKIANDQVFSWFHGPQWVQGMLRNIASVQPAVEIEYLPALEGSGFEPSYYNRVFRRPQWCIPDKGNEQNVIAALKYLEFVGDPANDEVLRRGVEGFNYKIENGQEVRIPPPTDQWGGRANNFLYTKEFVKLNLTNKYIADELRGFNDNAYRIVQQTVARPIEGQALPLTIYDGFPDIKSHKLYHEYSAKIILGEWPDDRFDEYVEKWNAQGGAEVTARAREIWAKIGG